MSGGAAGARRGRPARAPAAFGLPWVVLGLIVALATGACAPTPPTAERKETTMREQPTPPPSGPVPTSSPLPTSGPAPSGGPAPASGPVPASDLAGQIAAADLIVVARVERVRASAEPLTLVSAAARPEEDELRQADLVVARVLAGPSPSGSPRLYFLAGRVPSRPWLTLAEGQLALLVLRAVTDGYAPVTPTGLALPALANPAAPPAGLAPRQAVAHELEQVILAGGSATDPDPIKRAVGARLDLPGPVALARLDHLPPPVAERRAAWVALALAAGQAEALALVPSLFESALSPALETLQALAIQQIDRDWPRSARPALVALLAPGRPTVARAAAAALRRLGDPAAVPDLIAALDHPDQLVRYAAVMGLADLEPAVATGPALATFQADEARYIQPWKTWWGQRQR